MADQAMSERVDRFILPPCSRTGGNGDWWQTQHSHCTGSEHRCGVEFKCDCECHQSAFVGAAFTPKTPAEVGAEIRRLLFGLYAAPHSEQEERAGTNSYATDDLRADAIAHAGICLGRIGRMAPGCGCEWSHDMPSGAHGPIARHVKHMSHAIAFEELGEMHRLIRLVDDNLRPLALATESSLAGAVWAEQSGVSVKGIRLSLEDLAESIEATLAAENKASK